MNEQHARQRRAVARVCPTCNAQPGELCTQPDNEGRHTIISVHWSRLDLEDA